MVTVTRQPVMAATVIRDVIKIVATVVYITFAQPLAVV